MAKRTIVVLLAAVMLMGVLFTSPVMAAEENPVSNPGMESWVSGAPEGYRVNLTGTATATKAEGTAVHGGSAALCITGAAETDSAVVETTVSLAKANYDITAFMNLTAFTAGSGVKLELISAETAVAATDWFAKTAYTQNTEATDDDTPMGWRKMMLCYSVPAAGEYIIRVTFIGSGTVYLDDFAAVATTDYIRNGDFEGFAGDYKPAGEWHGNGNVNASTMWTEAGYARIIKEENGNHCLQFAGAGFTGALSASPMEMYYSIWDASLEGERVALQFDYTGSAYSTCVYVNNAASGSTFAERKIIGPSGGWRKDFSMYYRIASGKTNHAFILGSGNSAAEKIDNISLTLAEDELMIAEAEGGVTAKFVAFGSDYSTTENYRAATVIVARYRVNDGNILSLDGVEVGNDTAEHVAMFNSRSNSNKANALEVGETPLRAEATIAKGTEDAEYVYKAFAWDGIKSMKPHAVETLS